MEQNYNNEIISNKNEQDFQEENKNTNEYITNQEEMNNEQLEEAESDGEDDDDRLTYTLITLDLGNLIHIFEDNNISFVDMLLLTKEDLIELQLEIFQRNRIINFSKLFTKYAKNYSIQEISDFFTFNKQFIFNPIIYDKVSSSNINNDFQNELNNTNINNDNMNNLAYESNNPETNYINTEPNNRNNNTISANNPNFIFNQSTTNKNYQNKMKNSNPILRPKLKEQQLLPQNINGAFNSIQNKFPPQKINTKKNSSMNNNNNEVQDFFHEKMMNIVEKKKIEKPKTNKNIIINKGKMNRKEINKNEEFQKIIEKIGILESSEMNYDLYTKLNLIKNYINMKGDKMTSEDLINISNDINSMINSISNKNNNNNRIKFKK